MMSDGVRDGRIITTPPSYWTGRQPPGCRPRTSRISFTGGTASTAATAEPRWR